MTKFSQFIFLAILGILLFSCSPKNVVVYENGCKQFAEYPTCVIIDCPITVTEHKVFNKDVIIYPGTYITTSGAGKITFSKTVTVMGETQVFDKSANIVFADNSLAIINPDWWGARGDDAVDDTEVVQKVFDLAANSEFTQTIKFAKGNYLISKTLVFNRPNNLGNKALNISGYAMSASGSHGTSLTWRGNETSSMVQLKNIHKSIIENLNFKSEGQKWMKFNLDLKPFISSLTIQNCGFSGVSGIESSNISLNKGNGDQVSEIVIRDCHFRGVKLTNKISNSAISGGLSNCKNFYLLQNSFGAYAGPAIDIHASSMFVVENNTFFANELDIKLNDGNARIASNYSEESEGFYQSGFSSSNHHSFLVGNYYASNPKDLLAIKDGAGELVLINNNFGGNTNIADKNLVKVKWEVGKLGSITSIGNFFKGSSKTNSPFIDRSNRPLIIINNEGIYSRFDHGGTSGEGKIRNDQK